MSRLSELTAEAIETIRVFHATLHREVAVLEAGALEELPAITSEKMQLARQLERVDLERRHELLERGFGGVGLDAMLDALFADNHEPLARQWREATETLQECLELNARSGATIQAQTRYTQRALEILAGDLSLSATYDHSGRSGIAKTGNELGKA